MPEKIDKRLIIVGGGAAGFFGAIHAKTRNPDLQVLILESAKKPLGKVKISGGGRCNVTHHCFDVNTLVQHYPRGERELKSVFSRFNPKDTMQWFENRGVKLKTENDNRVFPVSDESQTIIDCLVETAEAEGVRVFCEHPVRDIEKTETGFKVITEKHTFECEYLLLAPGGSPAAWRWCETLGHTVIPPVPSLFTFKIADARLRELQGISFQNVKGTLKIDGHKPVIQTGDLLITHWGLSGPVVLRLSAWGARALFDCKYNAEAVFDFYPDVSQQALADTLIAGKAKLADKLAVNDNPLDLPRRFWERLLSLEGVNVSETRWRDLNHKTLHKIAEQLKHARFQLHGKGEFKEEFVTAGGVALTEIDFKTMESKKIPGLYFAGEIINVDGLTGGFNFQNAWGTGYIAGTAIATATTS